MNAPKLFGDRKPKTVFAPANQATQENDADFVPSTDEVARRAYFCYVNEGSRPGHHVQHWLKAEAGLLAERKLTRTHGFHNRTCVDPITKKQPD